MSIASSAKPGRFNIAFGVNSTSASGMATINIAYKPPAQGVPVGTSIPVTFGVAAGQASASSTINYPVAQSGSASVSKQKS